MQETAPARPRPAPQHEGVRPLGVVRVQFFNRPLDFFAMTLLRTKLGQSLTRSTCAASDGEIGQGAQEGEMGRS